MRNRGFGTLVLGMLVGVFATMALRESQVSADQDATSSLKKWVKGKGWGWVWGPEDEVGSLNEMTDQSRLKAFQSIRQGKVFDLGVTYSRNSYKWPGHSPGEIMTFRSPEGVKRQGDVAAFADPKLNGAKVGWHSSALFINDNVATQIDGLGHITAGDDNHWYNGFKEADWGGNFGIRKCGGDTIPPIIARGVLIDVAGLKGVSVLPSKYEISISDLESALEKQKTTLQPGDVVLIRTGTLSLWDKDGANHSKIGEHDSAGPGIKALRYLVEAKGAMFIGSDTSGLECGTVEPDSDCIIPGHKYLLIEQGIHIGEFHYLEDLAREKVYEFTYIAMTNKIAGSAAGFCLRPIAVR